MQRNQSYIITKHAVKKEVHMLEAGRRTHPCFGECQRVFYVHI